MYWMSVCKVDAKRCKRIGTIDDMVLVLVCIWYSETKMKIMWRENCDRVYMERMIGNKVVLVDLSDSPMKVIMSLFLLCVHSKVYSASRIVYCSCSCHGHFYIFIIQPSARFFLNFITFVRIATVSKTEWIAVAPSWFLIFTLLID